MFWGFGYPHALSYQEQFQLFLFDIDYFFERMAVPGGMAQYIAEFFVQMYNNVYVGAIIVTSVLVIIQQLTWTLMKKYDKESNDIYPYSFIISLLIWSLMGDPQVMYTFPFAILLTLVAMTAFPKNCRARIIFMSIGTPIIYWLVGPSVFILSLYATIAIIVDAKKKGNSILTGIVLVLYAVFCIILSTYIVPYVLERLFCGVDYYRYPDVIPFLMIFTMLATAVLPFCALIKFKKHKSFIIIHISAIVVIGFILVFNSFDKKTYELIKYDYMVRNGDWNAVIKQAEKQMPDLPMSVCATNLALAITNQLGERGFQFFQNGPQGLIPPFEKNFTSLQTTSELYWQLGLVNSAQRLAFESMECLPNYDKSCRVMKRLVETNIVNGQYDVARKYILILKKTLYYARWADRQMRLLGNEKAINSHPVYGKLRKYHLRQDFLFSEDEIDKICGRLFIHNRSNHLAMQYLLFYPLLQKDINKFMRYLIVVNKRVPYMPAHCQEAVVFAYSQNHQTPPQRTVSPIIMQQFSEFAQAYSQHGNVEGFRNTVWYYLTKQ